MDPSVARRMWHATEPIHALIYFAPEARAAFDGLGLKGFWMGYFASRVAPMGPVPAEVVSAVFYNFHPAMVHRAIPDAWAAATPEAITAARLEAAGAALERLLGRLLGPLREAAQLLHRAAESIDGAGRPLASACTALPWADDHHLELWQAITTLREFRGDGHFASLLTHGVDGCEAHVMVAANGTVPGVLLQSNRGWSEDDWAAASERLRSRGWLAGDGLLTPAGQEVHDAVERDTDRLALPPWAALGDADCTRIAGDLRPALVALVEQGALPFPNPIGLPPPT